MDAKKLKSELTDRLVFAACIAVYLLPQAYVIYMGLRYGHF